MGYELHIEREEPAEISAAEWLAVVSADDELELDPGNGEYFARFLGDCRYGRGEGWLAWQDGRISSKYPDNAILAKMLDVADKLKASVRGDDGEYYHEPDIDAAVEPELLEQPVSRLDRIRDFFASLFPPKNSDPLPFDVGDRVTGVSGTGTVVAIDRRAEHGMGAITVQYDDGRVLSSAIVAHGLEPMRAQRQPDTETGDTV